MVYAVEMRGITKRFPAVLANDHIDIAIKAGTVHAIIGENGAGKSTLMNILYGLHKPDQGEILINGQKQVFGSATDAIACGIGMVHQHFMLVPRLTVADNVVLGKEPRKGLLYDRKGAIAKVAEVCSRHNIQVDPGKKVADISLGMQQRVEIVKTLYRGAEIIILDEPTAVLTPQEIDDLGEILRQLKEGGKTIIIITHKLEEVMDFSDDISVLRGGKHIATLRKEATDIPELTRLMVGRDVQLGGRKESAPGKEEALRLTDIGYVAEGRKVLKGISLVLHKGEVLGLAGIDGSGQSQLAEIVAGVLTPSAGSIKFQDRDITGKTVAQRKKGGIGFIAQDRQKHGLVMDFSIAENLVLGFQRRPEYCQYKIGVNSKAVISGAQKRIKEYDIRTPGESVRVSMLSGGNQQKVVVAREMGSRPQLIVADQPTRGVDVGAIEAIHNILIDHRNKGGSVLLVSLELDELMMLSDRIAVFFDGRLMGILDSASATREQIGMMMVGSSLPKQGEAAKGGKQAESRKEEPVS